MTKSCERCDTSFEVGGAGGRPLNAKFCTRACWATARKSSATKTCEQCQNEFRVGGHGGRPRDQRFCSHACQGASRKRRTACEVCGKSVGRGKRKFCSRECYYKSERLTIKLQFTCDRCGKNFERYPSQRRLGNRKSYCSAACRSVGRVYKRGAEHPNYKPVSRWRTSEGYVVIEDGAGRRFEHRVVMEQSLGRPLLKSETVHHINGDRQDNRIENLQLRQGKHGKGVRMRCADCGSHNVEPLPIT